MTALMTAISSQRERVFLHLALSPGLVRFHENKSVPILSAERGVSRVSVAVFLRSVFSDDMRSLEL